MAIQSVFKSTIPNCTYLFANGKSAVFSEGKYSTEHPGEIAELRREIVNEGAGFSEHPFLYIDTAEREIDTTLQDKIREAQKKAVLEVLAEEGAKQESIAPTGLAALVAASNSK